MMKTSIKMESAADPAAQAEARGATRIARPGPNGWRMIYRGNTVLGRCQLVESATPGCSGTGGRDTYYYVESGCGPYSPRRENTTTLADVRALFESSLRSAKLSQTAALAALPGAAAAHRAAFAARRQDPNSADLLRASEEAATRLQQVINAAVASTPSGGRGHRAAAVAGRTFGLIRTRSQAGRRGNRKTETWWQVYETTPGTAPERVAESLGSLDAAHREIAKRCGLWLDRKVAQKYSVRAVISDARHGNVVIRELTASAVAADVVADMAREIKDRAKKVQARRRVQRAADRS